MFYTFLLCTCACIIFDCLSWFRISKEKEKKTPAKPFVSILLAIRNEENNILNCLKSLEHLSYPNLEILIGDDSSTDSSLNIVQNFIQDKPQFKVFTIQNQLGNAIAKANVLAQLAHQAKGEWFFITDADVRVPRNWIESMLSFSDKASIITGFTWVQGKGIFAILQALDWAFAIAIAKVFSYWNVPVTAMGNNMAVRKEAYRQTGGYEKMPATLVEDFTLFKKIVMEQKQKFVQVFDISVTAKTQAISSLKDFFHQRKRWMQGTSQTHWLAKLYLLFKVGFYPVFLATILFERNTYCSEIAVLYTIKLFWQSLALYKFLDLLRKRRFFLAFGLYELYLAVLSCFLPIYYLLPLKKHWKGRTF